jgi:predicted GNAT family N-acyltransferase/CRP-like cAMP-binding protein
VGSAGTAPAVTIRFARTAAEREAAFRLRYEVYVVELNMFAAVADHVSRRLSDEHDQAAELFIAYADDEPVGTLRLTFGADGRFSSEFLDTYGMDAFLEAVPYAAMVVFTRFIVRESFRGTSVPFELILASASLARERGIELVFCDCQPDLINLYQALGFRPYTRTYNDPHMALMVPMILIGRDGAYLRRVGSPLLGSVVSADQPTTELARQAASLLAPTPPVRSLERVRESGWSAEIPDGPVEQALRLFEGLDEEQLWEIIAYSMIIDLAPGDHLIREGQVTRIIYVLLGGELQYWKGRSHLANAEIGEPVGDIAFLLGTVRTIDVIAGPSGARVLSLRGSTLRAVTASASPTATTLLFNLCRLLAERVVARTVS